MEIEIDIEKTVFGGEGIGHAGGKVCFVEATLPGEKVLARITEEKANFLRATPLKILRPSPFRIEPPCRYASHCGGCQYQHVSYKEELALKEAQFTELMEGAGVPRSSVRPITGAGREFGYRNSVTMHPLKKGDKAAQVPAFIGKDNVSRIPIESCLLADERLVSVFKKKADFRGRDRVTFRLDEKGRILSDQTEAFLRIQVGDETLLSASTGFFQNNLRVAGLIAEKIRSWLWDLPYDVFYDLYAGAGTFSFLLADRTKPAIAIEEDEANVQALKMNREEKCWLLLEAVAGKVERIFPKIAKEGLYEKAVVFIDPPRQGLEPSLLGLIAAETRLKWLIYLSCDPATLARDLKGLAGSGLEVREAVSFDMFPRTRHIEAAAFLARHS